MNPFLLFFRAYWWQILCATACLIIIAYISILKHENNALERDNASLQATIASISALGKAQSDKADRIEQGGQQAAKIITDQYTSDLQKVKDYYAKHPTIKPVTHTISVCNTSSNSAEQMPSTNTSPERADANANNQVSAGQGLESDCAETTLMLIKLQEFETNQQAFQ